MLVKAKLEKKVGGSIAVLIGMLSLYEAYKLYPYSLNLVTGDHAFPGFIGLFLVAVGISMFFDKRTKQESMSRLPTGKTLHTLSASIITLIVYCIFIEFFGYVASTLVVSIALLRLIAKSRWMNAFLVGGLITAVMYYLFIVILKTPFPVGIFSF
ncbi:tripartite tricarboxylate transporter TctB family protein [Bacillus sp. FJAT-29814]|uniref:tripartite tricarboxylate transporter TctB family protein n=1 Tax=Bacillus sp. FJAT-29814 TaxID=1729688 RepID=UPI000A4F988D|nr:tripartite tricarboxylate transporter TctB family protein [Bacillus sp. FJAT-29814]